MAQPHGMSVPDGLEPVRHDMLPEFVQPYDEKQVSPHQKASPAAVGAPTGEKTIFGLRKPTFFLLLLLILVIIIAAVAGGVGGSVAVSNAYDRGKADAAAEGLADGTADGTTEGSTTTDDDDDDPTPTSSSSRVQPPPTKGLLALDCPDLSDTTESVKIGDKTYKFRITCGINHGSGGGSEDMMILPAYSLDDCITACASFNNVGVIDKTCLMVHFNAHIGATAGGNCWLKSKVGKPEVNNNPDSKDLMVEAELLDD